MTLLPKQIQPPTPRPSTSCPIHASLKTSVAIDNSCCATHGPQIPRHKTIGCRDLRPPPPIVVWEHVGTCSPIRGVWRRHPFAPGGNANPCSRLSAGMFTSRRGRRSVSQPGQQTRAFLAGPEKISSVAFLLARTEGNSHPSTTGTPQLKARVRHTGNASIPPSFLPLHQIRPSSQPLGTPLPKFRVGFQSRKVTGATHGGMIITDINLEEKSPLGHSYIAVHHRSARHGAFQELSRDQM